LRAAELLEAAGHEVLTCHDGSESVPCHVFENPSRCPIEHERVDAALVVHAAGGATTGYEAGAGCARRARLPMVVYSTEGHPFGVSMHEVAADVVAACERAASGRLEEHEAAALAAVSAAPLFHRDGSAAPTIDIEVHRTGDRLHVTVKLPSDVPASADANLADRAVRGVRSFDRSASIIDVTIER
jgi:hypothetical protein